MQQFQWVILLFTILFLVSVWKNNMINNVPEAKAGEYSDNNVYINISPIQHDIFKQLCVDVLPMLMFGLATKDELFNIDNFENSIIGNSTLVCIGYAMYYQLIQPYIINYGFFNVISTK